MADVQTRPFSKNYSGLVNQSVIGLVIAVLAITSQELMKRKRRGKRENYIGAEGVGSVESWEFGYLFQGRCWARTPSPPAPLGWPLSWVKESIQFPEDKMNELRGVDATLYIRFLRGCYWYILLHTFTTLPILLPIHVHFSGDSVPPRSMTRASITSLVLTAQGLSLLWIHICLLIWITLSWMGTLIWICHGAFVFRAQKIEAAANHAASAVLAEKNSQYHPHPHPQYPFQDIPVLDPEHSNRGLRMRTIMVSNVPPQLRKSEKDLKEYFEYYMSRPLNMPAMGLTSSTQPGFFNKSFAFLFHRAKKLPAHLPYVGGSGQQNDAGDGQSMNGGSDAHLEPNSDKFPVIDRVVIARKMTELASLLERREEVLRRLETAHIKLAKKTLTTVRVAMDERQRNRPHNPRKISQISLAEITGGSASPNSTDLERGEQNHEGTLDGEAQMDLLIETLAPFVEEFDVRPPSKRKVVFKATKRIFRKPQRTQMHQNSSHEPGAPPSKTQNNATPPSPRPHDQTVWEALLTLPRSALDPYQPLIHLSALFRGKTVPAIDYYTAKLGLLTSLITENRAKAVSDYDPVSTAFVTFADPSDARRACKYLAVHPNNPLACLVTMAPGYEDLDWIRVMKSTFRAEFVKDWVVNLGVWGFTVFWLFPVSLLVGLVSIESIGQFWPKLKAYLDRHPWEEEVIQSFLPTLLVALLAILIPLILLLIAKKAHTITTLSALHDTIMTRYYKFLIVNVLVFFCVGTAAVQSILLSFKDTTGDSIIKIVADSFPTAGPFYVGWLIFTTAMHGGFELALRASIHLTLSRFFCVLIFFLILYIVGLPLLMYPSTSRQVTPRKRAVGIRPRTFNYYYWLPNHMLVIHVLLLFSVLNPLVIPFALLYFAVEKTVVKNQLLHVYAKNYEGNGKVILIRLVRYSLDGLILAQAVFLAYMVVLKKRTNIGLAAALIVLTAAFKVFFTRRVRTQYERDDISEADVVCRVKDGGVDDSFESDAPDEEIRSNGVDGADNRDTELGSHPSARFWTWKVPQWINFSYSTRARRPRYPQRRQPNPFGPQRPTFSRLGSLDITDMPREVSPDTPRKPALSVIPQPLTITQEQYNQTESNTSSAVVLHPPPPSWDDESNADQPYENPYYTRPINNVLWLPRDPFGILNLDDTIDLRQSLTSELGAGQLGTWIGQSAFVGSPLPQSTVSLTVGEVNASPLTTPATPEMQYDGTEDIDLPPAIARRVQSLEHEEDIEHARPRRPSVFSNRHRGSGSAAESAGVSLHPSITRRSTSEHPPPSAFRSFSGSSTLILPRPRATSYASSERPGSAGQDPVNRPDAHAQAAFARSTLSIVNPSFSNLPGGGPRARMRSNNVSTQEAVVAEVVAEEEEALKERLRQEQAEVKQSKGSKSWLTSWMFSKAH